MITSWSWIPKNVFLWLMEMGATLCNFSCDDLIIKNSLSEKILGLIIDNADFSDHISNICTNANHKLNALFRVSAKCSLLTNYFIKSHFSYFPLIWMFCNWKNIKKVNKIKERYLHLMTNNCKLNYEELLEIPPHQRFLNSQMTEVYKFTHSFLCEIGRNDLILPWNLPGKLKMNIYL